MIGIVIATHGMLSDGLKDAAEVVVGPTQQLKTVNLYQGDDITALGETIKEAIEAVDGPEGVVVLTDLASASPYNQTLLVSRQLHETTKANLHLISGVNLPMVIEAINQQYLGQKSAEVYHLLVDQAISGITHFEEIAEDESEEDGF